MQQLDYSLQLSQEPSELEKFVSENFNKILDDLESVLRERDIRKILEISILLSHWYQIRIIQRSYQECLEANEENQDEEAVLRLLTISNLARIGFKLQGKGFGWIRYILSDNEEVNRKIRLEFAIILANCIFNNKFDTLYSFETYCGTIDLYKLINVEFDEESQQKLNAKIEEFNTQRNELYRHLKRNEVIRVLGEMGAEKVWEYIDEMKEVESLKDQVGSMIKSYTEVASDDYDPFSVEEGVEDFGAELALTLLNVFENAHILEINHGFLLELITVTGNFHQYIELIDFDEDDNSEEHWRDALQYWDSVDGRISEFIRTYFCFEDDEEDFEDEDEEWDEE